MGLRVVSHCDARLSAWNLDAAKQKVRLVNRRRFSVDPRAPTREVRFRRDENRRLRRVYVQRQGVDSARNIEYSILRLQSGIGDLKILRRDYYSR